MWAKKLIPYLILSSFVISATALAQGNETSTEMKWYSMEDAQLKAEQEGKKVLVFGYAVWCTYCRKMDKEVYTDTTVQREISEHFYPVRLNTESDNIIVFNGEEVKEGELAAYFRLTSLPTHYFVDEKGEILGTQPGFLPSQVFNPLLKYVGTDAYARMSFDKFMDDN